MKGWQIVRGLSKKPVSGIYADKREALAKADDLDSARHFDYSVREVSRQYQTTLTATDE